MLNFFLLIIKIYILTITKLSSKTVIQFWGIRKKRAEILTINPLITFLNPPFNYQFQQYYLILSRSSYRQIYYFTYYVAVAA